MLVLSGHDLYATATEQQNHTELHFSDKQRAVSSHIHGRLITFLYSTARINMRFVYLDWFGAEEKYQRYEKAY